jgi:NADH dehydrogenase FAD-containing subunit
VAVVQDLNPSSKNLVEKLPMKQGSNSQPPVVVEVEDVDVAIFGAGPAGLTTALALHKACPNLKVRCASIPTTDAQLECVHVRRIAQVNCEDHRSLSQGTIVSFFLQLVRK